MSDRSPSEFSDEFSRIVRNIFSDKELQKVANKCGFIQGVVSYGVFPAIKEQGPAACCNGALPKDGDYLLSHLRSTIGVVGLNFSVRNGKRWSPNAIVTLNTVDTVYND